MPAFRVRSVSPSRLRGTVSAPLRDLGAGPAGESGTGLLQGGGIFSSTGFPIVTTPPVPTGQFTPITGLDTRLNRYANALESGIQPLSSTGGSTNRGDPSPQAIKLV